MANHKHTTRAEFRTKVQQKLGEENVHWTNAELNLSIDEALLTFGAISGFWKENVFLNTQENKIIYDLFVDPIVGIDLIKPSVKYSTVFNWLNRDLLENITFLNPISEFLELDVYAKALEAKYNQYQQLTSLVLKQQEFNIPANQHVVSLPDDLIDIRRISFVDEFIEYSLDEADEESIHLNCDALNEFGTPQFYSIVYDDTKNLHIHPAPSVVGKLKLIYISAATEADLEDENVILNLPNNLVPYIKYGILADIFSNEGVFNDPIRAAYCQQRWEEGILIGRNYNSALIAKTNAIKQIGLDSLNNVDLYSDNTKVRTSPTILGFAGFNIFRIDVVPSAVQYSVIVTVVANAKLPVNDADFIRIDLEYVDTLADYVVHLAKLRNGSAEVAMTNNLKDNFLKTAINHNRRLLQAGITFDNLMDITKKQETEQPRIPIEV